MEDEEILRLFELRQESAIDETARKYGSYCRSIAHHILQNHEETEECLNDTWLRTWNSIPPQKPTRFRLYLAAITRHLAFDRWKFLHAQKRGGGEMELVLEELEECTAGTVDVEREVDCRQLRHLLETFLQEQSDRDRKLFLRRYFYTAPLCDIAKEMGLTENHASVILRRIRQKLRKRLEQEGFMQ